MQLSHQEKEVINACITELETTFTTDMPPKEADLRVEIVSRILKGFVSDKEAQ